MDEFVLYKLEYFSPRCSGISAKDISPCAWACSISPIIRSSCSTLITGASKARIFIGEFFILPEFTIEYAYHHLWNASSKQALLFPSRSLPLLCSNLPTRYFDEKIKNNYGFCRERAKEKKLYNKIVLKFSLKMYIFLSRILYRSLNGTSLRLFFVTNNKE